MKGEDFVKIDVLPIVFFTDEGWDDMVIWFGLGYSN